VQGTTENSPAAHKGSCGGVGGREAVLQVIPHRDGTVVISASSPALDIVLYARGGSCASGQELACANKVKGGGAETVTVQTQQGVPLWLWVDGYKYDKGPFTLQLTPQ
jgi:hypothetical protein